MTRKAKTGSQGAPGKPKAEQRLKDAFRAIEDQPIQPAEQRLVDRLSGRTGRDDNRS